MVKSSLFLALLLGVIFAQTIAARPSKSDSEDSDAESSDDGDNSDTDDESPALTCVLFDDLGCNTECSTIASAFSIKATGKCTKEKICQCDLDQEESLESLFRAKFDADDALKKIKKDKKLSDKVLEILQVPFQTIEQTKKQLKDVVDSAIYDQLDVNDTTPAKKLGMIGKNGKLDNDKIKEYVEKKLKSVLKSSSKKLTGLNYKSNLRKSLKNNTDEDLQSVINEVRRTKNKNLTEIVDDYLKSSKTKEEKNTDEDEIADVIGYQIIDQFVNHIEEKNKPAAKKSSSKSSTKNTGKKSKTSDKKSATSKKSSEKKETTKKKSASSGSRFELPDFDKNFLDDYGGSSMSESFKTKKYSLNYQKSSVGSITFNWRKGTDEVNMSISSVGSISQRWRLGNVRIQLDRSSIGSMSQTWDFGKTRYTYSKSSIGSMSRHWANGKREPEMLKKYQNLIDEWCDENDFLLVNKKQCTIY